MVKVEEWSDEEIENGCSFTALIDRIYAKIKPSLSFEANVKSKSDIPSWQENLRNKLKDLLGITDMLENKSEIVIVKGDPDLFKDRGSYTTEHFYLKSWENSLIPIYLGLPKTRSKGKKLPAFVCTHGHGQNKDILHGAPMKQYPNSHWAKDLTELGCITITMDQWGWAERGYHNPIENAYAHKMLFIGQTINGLRFFDAMWQVDYLLTRSDVDPTKIGIAGLSLGGTTATYTSAIDTRISMALIAGYLGPFKDSIIDYNHCSCNYIPQMAKFAEMDDIAALIAPRPVCYICGIKDTTFYIEPAWRSFRKLKKIYKMLNAEENCIIDEPDQGHDWNSAIALPFVKKIFFGNKDN